eukprot:4733132-Pyramimonas_sp.AAC.1
MYLVHVVLEGDGVTEVSTPSSSKSSDNAENRSRTTGNAAVRRNLLARPKIFPVLAPKQPSKLVQMYIDLGQDSWEYTTCHVCGLMYSRGELEDEKLHASFHSTFTDGMAFRCDKTLSQLWTLCSLCSLSVLVSTVFTWLQHVQLTGAVAVSGLAERARGVDLGRQQNADHPCAAEGSTRPMAEGEGDRRQGGGPAGPAGGVATLRPYQ